MNKTTATFRSLLQGPGLFRKIRTMKSNLFFIFPSWQVGGAEQVHLDILQLFKEKKPICIITQWQEKKGNKAQFSALSHLLYLYRWGQKSSFKKIALKKIASRINKQGAPVVFGSNNLFFYELIPLLASHVKIIDLTHSFSLGKQGYEKFSLPLADKIQYRVVLGEASAQVYRELYKDFGHPEALLQRFRIIPNQVPLAPLPTNKIFKGPLQVLFVARDSPEKRPELFFKIARHCSQLHKALRFTAVGGFGAHYADLYPEIQFTGEILDKETLNEYYRQAHVLLITSTFEGFPMVVLEAMNHKVVPLCTAVGEIPAFISPEKGTGFTVPANGSEQDLIQAFSRQIMQLEQDREKLAQMAEQGRKLIEAQFNAKQFQKSYTDLITY